MRPYILVVVGVLIGSIGMMLGLQADAQKTAPPAPVQIKGNVQAMQSNKLQKFDKPMTQPPHHRPPDHQGHRWHWHPMYGYVALPLNISPGVNTFVLPQTYVLPAEVQTYQVQMCTCPYCGKQFPIQLP